MVHSTMYALGRLFVIAGFAFSMLLGPLTTDVSAQETTDAKAQLSIKPVDASGSYFEVTMAPGETLQLQVELANFGEAAVDARTFAADAYTIINGGLGIRLDGEPTSGATRWLDYPSEELTLESETAIVRAFTVSVPENVTPGEYLTALVIQNAEATGGNDTGGVSLKQVNRQAISVAIDVPGERTPDLAIGSAEHLMVAGRSVIRTGVENPGNVRLKPTGEFTLTNPDGDEIANVPVSMGSIYAGTATKVEVPLSELLPAGEYTGTLWLEDSESGARAESGPLLIPIPVLEAPQQMQDSEAASDLAGATVVETRTSGIPAWVLMVAIPAATVLGVLIALGVVLGLRGRSNPTTATK